MMEIVDYLLIVFYVAESLGGYDEMAMNVANCPKCGKVYVKNVINDICPACVKAIDDQCDSCIKYLREHRGITLQQLSDETEVPLSIIIKFLREGRISVIGNRNIVYPCEVCGEDIREKNMCDSCRQKLKMDVRNTMEDHRRIEGQKKKDTKGAFRISDRLKDR
jgi:flagellar operon protein (TIGR03826 family)